MPTGNVVAGYPIYAADVQAELDAISALLPLSAVKTSDESVTSSTSLQDDNELFVTVAANTIYVVTGWLFVVSTSATPDFKSDYTAPSGATMVNSMWGQGTGATSAVGSPDMGVASTIGIAHTRGTFNGGLSLVPFGTLTVAGTAGTFRLRWAQNTSDAASVTVKAGSWIQLTPKP